MSAAAGAFKAALRGNGVRGNNDASGIHDFLRVLGDTQYMVMGTMLIHTVCRHLGADFPATLRWMMAEAEGVPLADGRVYFEAPVVEEVFRDTIQTFLCAWLELVGKSGVTQVPLANLFGQGDMNPGPEGMYYEWMALPMAKIYLYLSGGLSPPDGMMTNPGGESYHFNQFAAGIADSKYTDVLDFVADGVARRVKWMSNDGARQAFEREIVLNRKGGDQFRSPMHPELKMLFKESLGQVYMILFMIAYKRCPKGDASEFQIPQLASMVKLMRTGAKMGDRGAELLFACGVTTDRGLYVEDGATAALRAAEVVLKTLGLLRPGRHLNMPRAGVVAKGDEVWGAKATSTGGTWAGRRAFGRVPALRSAQGPSLAPASSPKCPPRGHGSTVRVEDVPSTRAGWTAGLRPTARMQGAAGSGGGSSVATTVPYVPFVPSTDKGGARGRVREGSTADTTTPSTATGSSVAGCKATQLRSQMSAAKAGAGGGWGIGGWLASMVGGSAQPSAPPAPLSVPPMTAASMVGGMNLTGSPQRPQPLVGRCNALTGAGTYCLRYPRTGEAHCGAHMR